MVCLHKPCCTILRLILKVWELFFMKSVQKDLKQCSHCIFLSLMAAFQVWWGLYFVFRWRPLLFLSVITAPSADKSIGISWFYGQCNKKRLHPRHGVRLKFLFYFRFLVILIAVCINVECRLADSYMIYMEKRKSYYLYCTF